MNAPLRQRMTLEQFLAWEAHQPERWEFDGFQPVAMVGGTREHSIIQHYVTLEQDRIAATLVSRRGEDWLVRVLLGGDALAMPEIGVEIPLAELYAGVEVDEATADAG